MRGLEVSSATVCNPLRTQTEMSVGHLKMFYVYKGLEFLILLNPYGPGTTPLAP